MKKYVIIEIDVELYCMIIYVVSRCIQQHLHYAGCSLVAMKNKNGTECKIIQRAVGIQSEAIFPRLPKLPSQ